MVRNSIISYESSKWYIKLWRKRWYLYAIFLYIKNILRITLLLDYIIDNEVSGPDKDKIRKDWAYIKKHIEISKMYKFSTK